MKRPSGCAAVVALVIGLVIGWSLVGGSIFQKPDLSRCVSVPPQVLEGIATGLTVDGGGDLRGGKAVKSRDLDDIWFVAADIEGPGLDGADQIGVWGTNSITFNELSFVSPAEALADEFTDWGDAGDSPRLFSTSDDGVDEAEACVTAALSGSGPSVPTRRAAQVPTAPPTKQPPTVAPTAEPTAKPTEEPPTVELTLEPTLEPTEAPDPLDGPVAAPTSTITPDPTETSKPQPTREPWPTREPQAASVPGSRCESVPPDLVARIESGLTVVGGGSLRGAQAVRSHDDEEIWIVAADIQGPGMNSPRQIGVWATSDMTSVGGGVIFAVNGIAMGFSDWDADTYGEVVSLIDDGVAEARACVKAALK